MNNFTKTICKPQFILTAGLWFAFVLAGCEEPGYKYERELEIRNDKANAKIHQLESQLAQMKKENKAQAQQIENLQKIEPGRLDQLVKVEKIKISSYCGGVNRDSQPGQDSVKIIFTPVDKDNDTIKAAGKISISLFDLKAKDKNKLATFDYTPTQALKHWAGGPLTNHYSFTLKIPEKFKGDHLDILVAFTDLLTGKTHTAKTTCEIIRQ